MTYTTKQLAQLAGISPRTLHHYDTIGLLCPTRKKSNDYRQYEESDLLKLQQIMFFKELDFPLEEIKKILESPTFDTKAVLVDQRTLIEIKKKRLTSLIKTINKTIKKITKEKNMNDKDLYEGFTDKEARSYAKEAKERWGNTEAYKQSKERVAKMSKQDMVRIQKENDLLLKEIVKNMDKGAHDPYVQTLIAKHYNGLRAFYEPNLEMYRGLGTMYVEDERFAAFFKKYHENLPTFMRDAMHTYCDLQV